MTVARAKGTRDLLPADALRFAAAEEAARRIFGGYGYGEIRTPTFEPTELFARSVGEATDIVHKEMFTFQDRGGRSLTLRPENTAGVVRAVVENRLDQAPMPLRLWYAGAQFRYERPQKGRYREFRQIGAELFGAPGPAADAEILVMLFEFLGALGFRELSVSLNAVPAGAGRERFSDALRTFAGARADRLGEDDRRRLAENPLRLFDSKDPEAAAMLENAPRAIEFLDPESRAHHDAVMELLRAHGIPFAEDPRLVRGLDYYTKTVFEVKSASLGAQDAILGGGRYDRLVADLGGPPLPAVGFAIGEDRLVDVMPLDAAVPAGRVRVIPLGPEQEGYALSVAGRLRAASPVECDLSGRGVKKGLAAAAELGFDEAAIVGPDEAREGTVTIKNLKTREQRTIALPPAGR
ncbi:MAG TPA: histidine--tRNA ligase [Thermoanaerobaculia bacterium]|nr:histidine--tRNA ligase [Thermoanaerobaculia bacterium]